MRHVHIPLLQQRAQVNPFFDKRASAMRQCRELFSKTVLGPIYPDLCLAAMAPSQGSFNGADYHFGQLFEPTVW